MSDLISREEAILEVNKAFDRETLLNTFVRSIAVKALNTMPSAEPYMDMAENLYPYKCYITDEDGLQHEVIHTGDIRRVTGWEI